MKIVILGKGNMGTPIAALGQQAGHDVQAFGREGAPVEALESADIVVIATKYQQALDLAREPAIADALSGKVVIDVTNPLADDFMSLTVGHTTSAAEEIARLLPGACLVKAFSTVFAAVMTLRAEGHAVAIPVFVAGDDGDSVATVVSLVKAFGFDAIPAGPLTNARYLEPLTELMIQLGYGLGHGNRVGFALVSAK